MKTSLLLAFLLVASCAEKPGKSANSATADHPVDRHRLPAPYRWDWRWVQIEQFDDFPREIQLLMQREGKENSRCRGGSGGNRSTLRACNRRQVAIIELRKLGWCWGGAETEAFKRWLRCEEDENFDPAELRQTQEPYFSDEDVNEALEDEPASDIRTERA